MSVWKSPADESGFRRSDRRSRIRGIAFLISDFRRSLK